MKLLAVASQFDRCEAHLLRSLSEQGVTVVAVVERCGAPESILKTSGIKIIERRMMGRVDPASIIFLRRLIKAESFDIVHAFSGRGLSNMLFATIGLSVKRVAYRGTMGHLNKFDPTSWISFLNPSLHKTICVSKAVENYLATKGVPQSRRTTIYKGHDIAWYQTSLRPTLQEFGIPIGAFVIGCVANVRPVKGIDQLIRAMSLLPSESQIHLLLIGEIRHDGLSELISFSTRSQNIHLTGFRSDAPAIVGQCAAFVMPSIKREGLPKAMIEAMSQSVPPIVTNVGGMPEVVRDRVDGIVVPPRDPAALAEAMSFLERNPETAKKLGASAQARIAHDFQINRTVEMTFAVYKDLLGV